MADLVFYSHFQKGQNVTLIQSLKQAEAAIKAAAVATYREILLRADHPEPGDAEALQQALTVLCRGTDRLERDLSALRQAAALEAAAAVDTPELRAALCEAHNAQNSYTAETRRIVEERTREENRLADAAAGLRGRQREAQTAAQRLGHLRKANWELFDLPAPPPPVPERHGITFQSLDPPRVPPAPRPEPAATRPTIVSSSSFGPTRLSDGREFWGAARQAAAERAVRDWRPPAVAAAVPSGDQAHQG